MDPEASLENLRKIILLSSSLNEKSLSALLKSFTISGLQPDEFLLRAGEYPLYLAFIESGIVYSYYTNLQGNKIIRGIFVPGMFAMPLPSFVYRKPSFMTFQAITEATIFHAKYSDLLALSRTSTSIQLFLRSLIDREWVVNRELHDAGLHVYNPTSRYEIFHDKYKSFIQHIPVDIMASYLNISTKQLERLQQSIDK